VVGKYSTSVGVRRHFIDTSLNCLHFDTYFVIMSVTLNTIVTYVLVYTCFFEYFNTAGDSDTTEYEAEFQGLNNAMTMYANNNFRPTCAAQKLYS